MKKKFAVILCGSGFKDGSEIRESVATLYALSKHQIEFSIYAPNENQYHVVNCITGEEQPSQFRNQMIEAGRIARGKVEDLKKLNPDEFDGIILPGGFGSAKNLCNYAFKGIEGSVHPEVSRVLNEFYRLKKPIGAICIAPMILALNFKSKGLKLSFGKESTASDDLSFLGHTHYETKTNVAFVDRENRIVTTGAYMDDNANLFDVFEGIEALVVEMTKLILPKN